MGGRRVVLCLRAYAQRHETRGPCGSRSGTFVSNKKKLTQGSDSATERALAFYILPHPRLVARFTSTVRVCTTPRNTRAMWIPQMPVQNCNLRYVCASHLPVHGMRTRLPAFPYKSRGPFHGMRTHLPAFAYKSRGPFHGMRKKYFTSKFKNWIRRWFFLKTFGNFVGPSTFP